MPQAKKLAQQAFSPAAARVRFDETMPKDPQLIVTLGDPAGIGPEVVLKALAAPQWRDHLRSVGDPCPRIQVVGCRHWLHQYYQTLLANGIAPNQLVHPDQLAIIDLPLANPEKLELGCATKASGEASFRWLERAIALAVANQCDGIVTGPIAKSAWWDAGHEFPGQTEVLAQAVGVDQYGMMFVATSPQTGWQLRALLATTHIPLAQVPTALTPDFMTQKLECLLNTLRQDFGMTAPRIAIAGLNPHSGEGGKLGAEEITWLIPWLEAMAARYPEVTLEGPIPPDTMWIAPAQAWYGPNQTDGDWHQPSADAYLALYHDQGLIPVKLMAFDRAVNTTIGLPFVRTSPDHGTAFDIAGKGIANPRSMEAAIALALQLVTQRLGAVKQ
jgi:4-hydroxythreonine-4-phosphate dehydrogenase